MAAPSTVPDPKRRKEEDVVSSPSIYSALLSLEQQLSADLLRLDYSPCAVAHVYNPLDYAREPHSCFVEKYGNSHKKILFLGMNPGPFGMGQNGVPFGDVTYAKDWLCITGHVTSPVNEHPKRPILGLESTRNEVSGSRFWGLMQSLATTPDNFFRNCYVHNYCPLCFMSATAKNITPPSMKVAQRGPLQQLCDASLQDVVELLQVRHVVGVGAYAEARSKNALKNFTKWEVTVCGITHPSPINPAANKNWQALATSQLSGLGLVDTIKGLEKSDRDKE